MKYLIMMFGDQASMLERRPVEWVREMIQFMHEVNGELSASGELVSAEGLVDASQAKKVDYADGAVVISDGPFAESKEARALEIASKVVAFTQGPIEVRQIGDAPPEL